MDKNNYLNDSAKMSIPIKFTVLPVTLPLPPPYHEFHIILYNFYRNHIWLWPLMFCIGMPPFFIFFYCFAAYNGHLGFILQYVSDSGTYLPSAGFFAMGLDLMAMCLFVTYLARYKQIKYYLHVKLPALPAESKVDLSLLPHLDLLNFLAFMLSIGNVLAIITVGNFRCSEGFIFHVTGAFAMFGSIFLYAGLQIYLIRQLHSQFHLESHPTTICIWLTCGAFLLLGVLAFNIIASAYGIDSFFGDHTQLHWSTDQPGYWWHVMSAGCEWGLINSITVLFWCLFRRMKQFGEWDLVDL